MIKKNKENGSFLLELMIGLLVSLMTILSVMTIFAEFEGQKRTSTQVSQALTNAGLSLFPIQHYGKMAGFGFNLVTGLGCTVQAYNTTTNIAYTFVLSPTVITKGASDQIPDRISFLTGSSQSFYGPSKLTANMPSSSAVYKVDNRFGYQEGDILIALEAGKDCTLSQISTLPSSSGQSDNIIHNSGNYTDPKTGINKPTIYNKPGGLGITYNADASLYNLGQNPQLNEFFIQNKQLKMSNNISGVNVTTVIGDNIVSIKAIYGIDTALAPGVISAWTNTTPSDPSRVIGVRVAVLAQSAIKEKKVGGSCVVTNSANIAWQSGNFDISNLPDWGCYRYRIVQTTIPMKNMIWKN